MSCEVCIHDVGIYVEEGAVVPMSVCLVLAKDLHGAKEGVGKEHQRHITSCLI